MEAVSKKLYFIKIVLHNDVVHIQYINIVNGSAWTQKYWTAKKEIYKYITSLFLVIPFLFILSLKPNKAQILNKLYS